MPPEEVASSLGVRLALGLVLMTSLLLFVKVLRGNAPSFLTGERQLLTLVERTALSHDTVLFTFGLQAPNQRFGLPIGKHIKLIAPNPRGKKAGEWNGKPDPEADADEITRKYTPTTSDDDLGKVSLVIKVYKGGVLDRFPDGGKMSQHMGSLKVGHKLKVQGPVGMHAYLGNGVFTSGSKVLPRASQIGMLAGGTGITPMLQLAMAILKEPDRGTSISLLYANQSEDDILCRDMLDAMQEAHPRRFKVWYTLDRPPKRWQFSEGFISETMIKQRLPPPSDTTLVLMCGPPPMVKFACQANLDKLGYAKSTQVVY